MPVTDKHSQDLKAADALSDWYDVAKHDRTIFSADCCGGRYDVLHFICCSICGKPLALPKETQECLDKIREAFDAAK